MEQLKPVAAHERISIMDALRGFAIFGIFIANLGSGFSFYTYSPQNTGPYFHQLDHAFEFWQHVFIEGKFYSIFSLLFGWGMAIQLKRSEVKGLPPVFFMRRRLGFMLLLGLAHLLLLWTGDIVAFYALVGFIFLWLRNWPEKKLFITAIILLLCPIPLYYLKMKFNWVAAPTGLLYQAGGIIDEKLSGVDSFDAFKQQLKHGNYITQLKALLPGVFYRYADLFFQSRVFKVLGMFILGYLLGKNDRYKQLISNTKLLWIIVVAGFAIGLPCNYMLAHYMAGDAYYQLKPAGLYRTIVYAFGVGPQAIAYVAMFFLLSHTSFGKKLFSILQPVGKMAFSNYITHSIIGTLVFYGCGLGLMEEVGPVYYTIFGVLVFIAQIIISTLWLQYFNYGPIEWLWRSLTYGKAQPMKLKGQN
ncbi:DUF418 domain-containing protein [soil metagenome]